jgi:hypothetical protein
MEPRGAREMSDRQKRLETVAFLLCDDRVAGMFGTFPAQAALE